MNLTEKINGDIKAAMLAKERPKLEALRAIKAALLLEATKEGGGEITEAIESGIIQKLYKQRIDSAKIYNEQNRQDLEADELFQAEVIKVYMPTQMSEDEVKDYVSKKVAEIGASGPQDMGKVMGPVMAELKGKADGALISKIVKAVLS